MFEVIFDFALLGALYALIWVCRLKKRDERYRVWFTLFYIYVCMVVCVTLMPFQIVIPGSDALAFEHINLEPFRDIRRGYLGAKSSAVLNCVMFVPLGFMLPTLKKRGIVKVTAISLVSSLCIEGVQFLYNWGAAANRRSVDVTDVIMNTAGGIIGYVLFRFARPVLIKLDERLPV